LIPERTSELVRLRLEQVRSTLNDAVVLAEGGGTPKSIINRAYYAMFYAVLALLQSIGKVAGKHTGAIGLFDNEFVLKGALSRELSRDLHRAFDARQEAEEYIDKARRFVADFESYLRPRAPA
jgi:uncharacterized protein (UPF0332 family)